MKTLAWVCLTCALVAWVTASVAPPIAGRWEGERDGLKAAILTVRPVKDKLEGDVIFWMERDGRIAGMDQRRLIDPQWDGKTLRFAVGPSDMQPGPPAFEFAMTLRSRNAGLLMRLRSNGADPMAVPLRRKESE